MKIFETALVVCPHGNKTDERLLGLTIGDRLLLTLERAGVRRVHVTGEGPRPSSPRAHLKIVEGPPEEREIFEIFADSVLGAGFSLRVTDDRSRKAAVRALLDSLKKPVDGIVSRSLNRRFSTTLSRFLVELDVPPNVLTVLFALIGLSGGLSAWIAQPWWALVLAGVLVQLQSILDGCDGEISRLTFRSSKLGQWLDSIGDDLTNYAFCFGLAAGQARVLGQPYLYWAGGITLAAQCLASAVLYRRMRLMGTGDLLSIPDTVTGKRFPLIRELFKRDTFLFITAALCAAQLPLFAFYLFVAGTIPMAAAVLINDLRISRC